MKFSRLALLFACSSLVFAACGNNETYKGKKKGLDASLVNNPRTANTPDNIATQGLATMDFTEDTAYDFGKMHEGEAASHQFKFTNNGKAPLLIANAAGSCGCTVPDYPHSPIAPGQSGVINVKFNSRGKFGPQNKTVTIYTNSTKGKNVLTITADVSEQ